MKPTEQDITAVLADVANAVVGHFEMATLLDQIINTTMKTLHARVCSIFLEDKEKEPGVLTCVAGSGFAEKIVGLAKYRIGEGFTGTVAKYGKEYNIKSREDLENLTEDGEKVWKGNFDNKQWPSGESEFKSCLALPLKIKDQILGVMKVENKDREYGPHFEDEDLKILKTVANVIALAIENARLHKQIEDQLRMVSAKAAHRMNNQVTTYDYIELVLRSEANQAVPDKERVFFLSTRLGETTKNIKRTIAEFKNYGKPIQLNKGHHDINSIIQDEVWHAQPPPEIKIDVDLDSRVRSFRFDGDRFSESMKELLQNSMRILLEKRREGRISISTTLIDEEMEPRGAKAVRIIFKDDGPGFQKDFPVFTPFQSTNPERTGLGLATVKELVEAHAGTIELKDVPEGGACFEIFLPIE